jgi:murein DD-endopeptidase MepM/ murein hydrolase activator NlpD
MALFRLLVGCVMSKLITGSRPRLVVRLVLAGFGASLLAGCAESGRFGQDSDPLGNPFKTSSRVDSNSTSAINRSQPARVATPVQSRPLPAPSPVASYSAPAHASPQLASSQGGQAGWSASGGTPVVVANGETIDTISTRYGVPRDALIRANGFASASDVRPGTRLIVPVYNASLAASSGVAPASTGRIEKMKFVKGAEPVATKADKHLAAKEIAMANKQMAKTEKPMAKADKAAKTGPAKVAAAPAATAVKQPEKKMAMKAPATPVETRKVADPTPTASLPPAKATETTVAAASDSANPEFRWPAHGRVIQGFKTGSNDGINIAVPEGTQVKAVESGVVAYAGSELKGYGNLVLIRHPNGFVSAYANNSDIEVKRGDTVKRGQTIAKSGQSGNVASPQLHFELRKGSTPVDPTQYLAGL